MADFLLLLLPPFFFLYTVMNESPKLGGRKAEIANIMKEVFRRDKGKDKKEKDKEKEREKERDKERDHSSSDFNSIKEEEDEDEKSESSSGRRSTKQATGGYSPKIKVSTNNKIQNRTKHSTTKQNINPTLS